MTRASISVYILKIVYLHVGIIHNSMHIYGFTLLIELF